MPCTDVVTASNANESSDDDAVMDIDSDDVTPKAVKISKLAIAPDSNGSQKVDIVQEKGTGPTGREDFFMDESVLTMKKFKIYPSNERMQLPILTPLEQGSTKGRRLFAWNVVYINQ